jgi:hypothetical protein
MKTTATKYSVKLTRKSDGKEIVKNFATKKDMQRFFSNNYTTYTW